MITRIGFLKNISKFKNFNWDESQPDFKKVNLIFGYNGSGKTTISNTLRLFSTQNTEDSLFQGLSNSEDAKVTLHFDGRPVNYSTSCMRKDIYVFNSEFVREHVFDGTTLECKKFNDAVITKEQLKNPLISSLEKQVTNERNKEISIQEEIKDQEKRFDTIKKELSKEFNVHISGSRAPGMRIPDHSPTMSISDPPRGLEKAYVEYNLSQMQSQVKQDLDNLNSYPFKVIGIDIDIVKGVLSQNIAEESRKKTQQRMDALEEFELQPDKITLSQWFMNGYRLLEHLYGKKQSFCPLCESDLKSRMTTLLADYKAFFSDEYSNLIEKIDDLINEIDQTIVALPSNENAAMYVASCEKEYADILQTPKDESISLDDASAKVLKKIQKQLLEKKEDTTRISWQIDQTALELIQKNNEKVRILANRRDKLTVALSDISKDPNEILKKIRGLLVECVEAEFNGETGEHQIEKYNTAKRDHKETVDSLVQLETEMQKEIGKLRDESRYVNNFLKKLGVHHFELVLEGRDKEDDMRIQYDSGAVRSKLTYSLSESEKTALAFAYFLSKIQYEIIDNNQASLADTIIVIDDPVSSLDEGRLHVTSCLIDSLFKEAEQLFVLSHNLIFMKFLSNVLGNVKVTDEDGKKVSSRQDFYLCNYRCTLAKLPPQLKNYRTTYFQRVDELIQYSNGTIEYEQAKTFLPNHIRTVLETFLSFKFYVLAHGSSNDQFRSPGLGKLIKVLNSKTHLLNGFEEVNNLGSKTLIPMLEEIKRITDPQSHGSPQDIDEVSFVSEHELKKITRNALDIIRFLDQIHAEELGVVQDTSS